MEHQDWTTVIIKKRSSNGNHITNKNNSIELKNKKINENARLLKLDVMDGVELPKKYIQPESLQSLIRKRIEMNLTQDKADQLCNFPRNFFKDVESKRIVPNEKQQSLIQKYFNIQLKYL